MIRPYVLNDGRELTVEEMVAIHNHYELECTMEFLEENYDYSSEERREIAREVRMVIDKYGYNEDEAIEYVINNM